MPVDDAEEARLHDDAPRASRARADLPARWDTIIARCLVRDPRKRPRLDDVLRDPLARRVAALLAWLPPRRTRAP